MGKEKFHSSWSRTRFRRRFSGGLLFDITDLDPIEFDLIFERFLNPDRISMPDFDIDFCRQKRDKVFEYLKSKYKDGVAHIITFGKFKARMALRDVGR